MKHTVETWRDSEINREKQIDLVCLCLCCCLNVLREEEKEEEETHKVLLFELCVSSSSVLNVRLYSTLQTLSRTSRDGFQFTSGIVYPSQMCLKRPHVIGN